MTGWTAQMRKKKSPYRNRRSTAQPTTPVPPPPSVTSPRKFLTKYFQKKIFQKISFSLSERPKVFLKLIIFSGETAFVPMGSFSQTIQRSHAKKLKLNGEIGGHVIQLVARESVKGKKSKF